MLERILLAAVITFCVYLFLNFGGKPSSAPSVDANADSMTIPGLIHRVISFSF